MHGTGHYTNATNAICYSSSQCIIVQVLGSRGNLYAGPMFYTSLVGDDFYRVLITNMTVGGIAVDVPCREVRSMHTVIDPYSYSRLVFWGLVHKENCISFGAEHFTYCLCFLSCYFMSFLSLQTWGIEEPIAV